MPVELTTIPGWSVTHLTVTRHDELTDYQRTYGALDEIHARDDGELLLLCDAQTRLAERLATAEALVPSTR